MTTDGIGLYVHIPFCLSKCKYCDFASFGGVTGDVRARYVARLVEELRGYKREKRIPVDTVFFGGGTPSLLTDGELALIVSAIHDSFALSEDAEMTLEANPKTLTREKLDKYKLAGVNRLSIGMQSIHENELKILGRIHGYFDFEESFRLARSAGFENVSVDLMYAIPEQTVDSLRATLDKLLALSPTHISAYSLIVEEGTPFYRMKDSLALPDEDTECRMYELITEALLGAGYSHYEISNYARAGYECRHNLKYWRDEQFIGVGLSAYSYFEGSRYGNSREMNEYLSENYVKYRCVQPISSSDEEYEYAMMRLRLREGFSTRDYRGRFSKDFLDGRSELVKQYISAGLMLYEDGRLSLTERGFYVSNAILSELL